MKICPSCGFRDGIYWRPRHFDTTSREDSDPFSHGRGSEVSPRNVRIPTKERTASALRSRYGEPPKETSPIISYVVKTRKKACLDCGRPTRLQWDVFRSPFLKNRICQSCAKKRGIWK